MTELDGQTDIFAELGEPAPVPPFTVFTCVWAENRCGWCGGKGFQGGGAVRNPKDKGESWFFRYCGRCQERYGHPRVGREGFPVVIDRTQKPRPGGES